MTREKKVQLRNLGSNSIGYTQSVKREWKKTQYMKLVGWRYRYSTVRIDLDGKEYG